MFLASEAPYKNSDRLNPLRIGGEVSKRKALVHTTHKCVGIARTMQASHMVARRFSHKHRYTRALGWGSV